VLLRSPPEPEPVIAVPAPPDRMDPAEALVHSPELSGTEDAGFDRWDRVPLPGSGLAVES
jgi:hypothetical protein